MSYNYTELRLYEIVYQPEVVPKSLMRYEYKGNR